MLQNAYLLAKIGADTAENEQHFAEILPKTGNYASGRRSGTRTARAGPRPPRPFGGHCSPRTRFGRSSRPTIFANFCKSLAGSFSAVSKRNFARKYAFDSIFQALQDFHPFAPLQSQIFRKKSVWKIANFAKFLKCSQFLANSTNFFKKMWFWSCAKECIV